MQRLAQQRLRSAVNFGVVASARRGGARPDERLRLRCECGQPGCDAAVTVSLREYETAVHSDALLTTRAHRRAAGSLVR